MPAQSESSSANQANTVDRSMRQLISQLGPIRLLAMIVFLMLALLVARFAWDIPLLRDAESALYDIRAANFAPQVPQDERIVMVVYTDQTLRDTGQRSPVDRTILANALRNIDAMDPKSIGIDILFDQPQDDDPLLQQTFQSMQTPTHIAYASVDTNAEAIRFEQQEFLEAYLAEAATGNSVPTSIRLETDSDNVVRRWPEQPAELPTFFSIALAGEARGFDSYRGPIIFRAPEAADRPVFAKFPIDLFADPVTAEFLADQIAGRHVLIGGDFVDFDQFDTPFTRTGDPVTGVTTMIGLEVHAHMLAQLLDNAKPATVPGWLLWIAAILVITAGAMTALTNARAWVIALLLISQLALLVALPFWVESLDVHTLGLPSFGWAIGWLMTYASVSASARVIGSKQRAFAQGALGKYLPKSVASEILKNPDRLALHGEKREIFCVFTDLEGFTKLSHAIEPEMVAQLLNDYLDRLAAVVLEYGGTLDKFVGDAVVAFWGAPISYPDDGERAARAAYAMYEAGEAFRKSAPPGTPPIGRTRVGMHFGPAIVGNFGGEGRIQYTAFGDSMNTAARLEAANKALDTTVLVSREAAERSGLDWYRPMGTITLRGRSTPVEIFEPMPEWEPQERAVLANIVTAHAQGESDAVSRLTDIVAKWGEDNALSNLKQRLQATGKGESYVLG
ncbi:MAG: adenylate/guanylate cyclase domain-containing protein [Pseudomonadota bacterium]